MSLVELHDVHKRFGDVEVLKGVSTGLEKGEIVAVIGRSGSGKSTMLRCVNGLEQVQAGRIVVDGIEVTMPGADLNLLRQRVGMVFQSYNLFPHLTVERNVMLALRLVKKLDREAARRIAREMVAKVGELELKVREGDPVAVGELAGLVGEALLDCGQRERALPLLQLALEMNPDSLRVKDAVAAAEYDAEDWIEQVEQLQTQSQRMDALTAARMLLRAARIVHLETPDDALYEELLRQVLSNDPQNESANFLYESLLSLA